MSQINLYNCDCMEYMKDVPDNYYDLSIVDPPYGIGFSQFNRTNKNDLGIRMKANKYKNSNWDDSIPINDYFDGLLRISKNQIIWGGNYFEYLAKIKITNLKTIKEFKEYIKKSPHKWIFWYKQNPVNNFADGELAWISFPDNNQFNFRYYGNLEGNSNSSNKIHPTQKPVKLYEWLLLNYAKQGQKIFDSHGGSMSIAIACHNLGFDLDLCELDKDYFEAGKQRFEIHKQQLKIF